MVQVLCKIWGLGMFSILALTMSNILLTLRLLRTGEDGTTSCNSVMSSQNKPWAEKLKESNHSRYLEFLQRSAIVVSGSGTQNDKQSTHGTSFMSSDNHGERRNSEPRNNDPTQKFRIGSSFVIDPILGRFDNRKLFKTFDKVFTGPDYQSLVNSFPACLATQSSVDRLFWLTQVSKHWENAPVSIAIFTPDVEYSIARAYLQYLITCFPYLGKQITVHFTYPIQFPPKEKNLTLDNLLVLCDRPLAVLRGLLKKRPAEMLKWRETLQYPQNLLRNVARKNCGTEWVFLTDVDIIPIPNLSQDVGIFLKTNEATKCKRCAFVIPTYEVDDKSAFPSNRTHLLKLVSSGKARPFHQKVFVYNQHATNFSRWEAREKSDPYEKKVHVSHDVTSFEFFYEPFYIAKDNVPPHDERFLGYGFTRNTQVYEMYIAGYRFRVLSPIFTLHWGMQIKRGRPSWRERQNSANRKLFEGFKREVFAKYQRDPLGMMREKSKKKKIVGKRH